MKTYVPLSSNEHNRSKNTLSRSNNLPRHSCTHRKHPDEASGHAHSLTLRNLHSEVAVRIFATLLCHSDSIQNGRTLSMPRHPTPQTVTSAVAVHPSPVGIASPVNVGRNVDDNDEINAQACCNCWAWLGFLCAIFV